MPPTKYNTLKILIIFGCGFLCYPLYHSMAKVLSGHIGFNITMPVFITMLIIGLWRLTEWARLTVTALVLVIAIIVPFGIINPFSAMDMINPPPVLELALKIYIPIALSIAYVFWLGRYRSEFRKKLI